MAKAEQHRLRALCLGSDRAHRVYWLLSSDRSRVYVEEPVRDPDDDTEEWSPEARVRMYRELAEQLVPYARRVVALLDEAAVALRLFHHRVAGLPWRLRRSLIFSPLRVSTLKSKLLTSESPSSTALTPEVPMSIPRNTLSNSHPAGL